MSTKINKSQNRWRFLSQPGWLLKAQAFPCGVQVLWMSCKAQGSLARAAWSCATRGGEADTTCRKLKKSARSLASGNEGDSSFEGNLKIIISPILFHIFGVIYIFIAYQ
jgi:hypothetical protein